jgi:Zn-dependent peptidase ImmA (M78 family)
MSAAIPVNPVMLGWARQCSGLSLEDVAAHLNKRPEDVEAWERGDTAPTYVQLETLAYKVYKRPLAMFFFPAPPEEEDIIESFRTLPVSEQRRIPPRLRYLLRKAQVLQLNLTELYDGTNPAERHVVRDLDFPPDVSAYSMAQQVREYLGVSLEMQISWDNADEALRQWREAIEVHGVFVFKDSFRPPGRSRSDVGDSLFSGFCLYDIEFPIVYVNNNKSKTRQIFTLFHELAHILMRTGGVDTRLDDYINDLAGNSRQIEILCNRFAGEFLVPSVDFERRTAGVEVGSEAISELAHLYGVSREVILRRFLDNGRVNQSYYEQMVDLWAALPRRTAGSGGDYYRTKGAYLGKRYVEKVIGQLHRNQITLEEAADYLYENAKNVPGIEEWVFGQEASQ